mmetsp:Transcript_26202/g.82409  ORF Transcript_26202/g.82409 Transcript_26202/m.82409 type:complete len:241 (-) Transcript_26202:281-1003(-)
MLLGAAARRGGGALRLVAVPVAGLAARGGLGHRARLRPRLQLPSRLGVHARGAAVLAREAEPALPALRLLLALRAAPLVPPGPAEPPDRSCGPSALPGGVARRRSAGGALGRTLHGVRADRRRAAPARGAPGLYQESPRAGRRRPRGGAVSDLDGDVLQRHVPRSGLPRGDAAAAASRLRPPDAVLQPRRRRPRGQRPAFRAWKGHRAVHRRNRPRESARRCGRLHLDGLQRGRCAPQLL